MSEELTRAEYQALLRQDFTTFVARCFHELNPQAELAMNWHLEVIAAKLTAVRQGKIRRLIINLPPRHLKSLMASIAFPAWCLGHDPSALILCVSYAQDLADKLFQLAVGVATGSQQLAEMAPIHSDEVQRAVEGECGEVPENASKKGGEFGPIHLAASHRERAMVDRPETAGVTIDRHIVGRVGERHRGPLLAHQCGESCGFQRSAA